MLLQEILLFIILITVVSLIKFDYFKNRKRRTIGHVFHSFFYRNLYDDYDQWIEEAEHIEKNNG